ncbi:MAG: hypothetical protein Q9162_002883 [Coniocarpon cinnabarinum]
METPDPRRRRQKITFSPGRIFGDPFALATISISILAWLIAFISAIVSKISDYARHPFPNFAWWTIAYYFLCIVGIILLVAFDATVNYAVAVCGFLAYALFLSTSAIDNTIWDPFGPHEAAAAGFILLAVVSGVWIFYFGTAPSSGQRVFIDSFALHGSRAGTRSGSMQPAHNHHYNHHHGGYPAPHQYPRSQLGGLEASSPEPRYQDTSRTSPEGQGRGFNGMTHAAAVQENNNRVSAEPVNSEYPYKARAIYSYDANPDDANELSFSKHEVLDVSDVSGRWWQTRKSNGETGIAPSNYLILL